MQKLLTVTATIILFFISLSTTIAQVGIGTLTPAPSAQLEVAATNKGVLIPRMLSTARTGISSPATGLLVYQTDAPAGFYYYDGTTWRQFGVNPTQIGFSATTSAAGVAATADLTGWSTAAPFYNSGAFNATTGAFTVPVTGTYQITANISYQTLAAISVAIGAGVNPYFEVYRSAPTNASLLQSYLPILNVNIALVLTLRTILGNGTVPLSGTINLTAGDVINLRYVASGLTVGLNLGSTLTNGIVWSISRVN